MAGISLAGGGWALTFRAPIVPRPRQGEYCAALRAATGSGLLPGGQERQDMPARLQQGVARAGDQRVR